MEAVTKYRAKDGSEWNTQQQAAARENLCAECEAAMQCLKPRPEDLNWSGYVQQDEHAVLATKARLYEVANREGVLKWWIDEQKASWGKTDRQLIEDTHPSWFGRMLDGSHEPLGRCYGRLCCIDQTGREWNQPYYANNPPAVATKVG